MLRNAALTNPATNGGAGKIAPSFDPVWEEIYSSGTQLNRYPYDSVVGFVMREKPHDVPPSAVRILEIGCGAGNNLWFAAREGFQVAGIDASPSVIAYARNRFSEEGLSGDLRVGDFTSVPFESSSFDLAINRAAITQTGLSSAAAAVREVRRVLKTGGKFYNEMYSDQTRHGGRPGPDGVTLDVEGWLAGVGQICFYSKKRVVDLFADGWRIGAMTHAEYVDVTTRPHRIVGDWHVTAIKV